MEALENSRLQSLQEHAICSLHLSVGPRVADRGPVHADVVLIAEADKFFAGELGAVVGDDGVRDPEAVDDVGEELDYFLSADPSDGPGLDPLGELVDGYK